MLIHVLRSKIHHAWVTAANLNYEGSITIDESLMEKVGILPFEKVYVLNISNGTRAETYVIKGKKDSGEICMNGAIARLAQIGDPIIILAFGIMEEEQAKNFKPVIALVDEKNRIVHI